jgi:hypothetical protein
MSAVIDVLVPRRTPWVDLDHLHEFIAETTTPILGERWSQLYSAYLIWASHRAHVGEPGPCLWFLRKCGYDTVACGRQSGGTWVIGLRLTDAWRECVQPPESPAPAFPDALPDLDEEGMS